MVKSKRARDALEAEEKPVVAEQAEAPAKKRKRSDDEPAVADVKKKSKKDKKKDKPETRREKKDKRKDLLDLPEDEANEEDQQPEVAEKMDVDEPAVAADETKKEKKKQKKEKKEKKNKDQDAKVEGEGEGEKKEKKDKKDKKEKKDKKKSSKTGEPAQNGDSQPADTENPSEEADGEADGKADRHIVFVGNLPYSATAESITAHFASLSPVSVRCLTKREDPKACRGIAFVEFGKVWHMRTCLDKFHHSMFDDGLSPARKINVELTAGGGGKTQQRQEKIKQKNIKLDENRAKRIEKEKTAKEENKASGGGDAKPAQQQHQQEDYIHPSRRARVPGQKW